MALVSGSSEHEATLRAYGPEIVWLEQEPKDESDEEAPAKPKRKRSRKASPAAVADGAVSQ